MHFRPGLQLPFNSKGINIDLTGGVPSIPVSVELEGPDAALAYVTNQARLLKGFPGCDFMGCEAANGIPLWNDPAPTAS